MMIVKMVPLTLMVRVISQTKSIQKCKVVVEYVKFLSNGRLVK